MIKSRYAPYPYTKYECDVCGEIWAECFYNNYDAPHHSCPLKNIEQIVKRAVEKALADREAP